MQTYRFAPPRPGRVWGIAVALFVASIVLPYLVLAVVPPQETARKPLVLGQDAYRWEIPVTAASGEPLLCADDPVYSSHFGTLWECAGAKVDTAVKTDVKDPELMLARTLRAQSSSRALPPTGPLVQGDRGAVALVDRAAGRVAMGIPGSGRNEGHYAIAVIWGRSAVPLAADVWRAFSGEPELPSALQRELTARAEEPRSSLLRRLEA